MTQHTFDPQKMFCMRCGAWDPITGRPDENLCGMNNALLTKGKIQGFNCKLMRWEINRRK